MAPSGEAFLPDFQMVPLWTRLVFPKCVVTGSTGLLISSSVFETGWCKPGWSHVCYIVDDLNLLRLLLLGAGVSEMQQNTEFVLHWTSNPGLCACSVSMLPSDSHPWVLHIRTRTESRQTWSQPMSSSRPDYLPSAITLEAVLQHVPFRGTQTLCVKLFAGLHIA